MYVGGPARYFVEVDSIEELKKALIFAKAKNLKIFILGGGSNVLISDKGFDGLVIKINIKGVNLIKEDQTSKYYEVMAGENWDEFVLFSVNSGLYGIENLSHIPGTVGASVVQNIGAYGQEVSTSVISVNVLDIETLTKKTLSKVDLIFSYRKSILNTTEKGKFVILSVVFALKKSGELNTKYEDIKRYFDRSVPNLSSLRNAIIEIRNKKFPYPDSPSHGTVGSFWNAEPISLETFTSIINKLRELGFNTKADEMESKKTAFTVDQGYKVVPGLFIEILNLKGKSFGGAKILESHAGIINNFTGEATAADVKNLSDFIVEKLKREFDINVRVEPELVGEF
jgi:UDP-N-acetylmuramate dehydrogenase